MLLLELIFEAVLAYSGTLQILSQQIRIYGCLFIGTLYGKGIFDKKIIKCGCDD
jgi:hypothetical protein